MMTRFETPPQAAGQARPRGRKPRRRALQGPVPETIVLNLPKRKGPGGLDLAMAGALLVAVATAGYLAGQLPSRPRPAEETVTLIEVPPPPVEVKEPPKPPPPPPDPPAATPPPRAAEPPPQVFGLQPDETSEAGDFAVATGNTLATKADSIVSAAPPPAPPAPVELDRAPAFLKQVVAVYPEWAQEQGVEAVALVWVTIDAEGRVTAATLQRRAGKDFDANALAAARASLFQPLVRDGRKLPSRFVVTYDYRLQ